MKRSASFLLFLFLCQSAYASIAFENLASISRDPVNAHRALKQAEINQYSARPALAAAFAGEAFNKIGDYAMKQAANGDKGWEDGGAKKVLAHAVIGAITAQISDGKALAGALAAGAREGMSGLTAGSSDLTQQIVSTTIGAAAGAVGGNAGAGAVTAWNGERFNRQLHQREINLIKLNAREFATQQGISVEEATKILSRTAVSMIDETWSQQKHIQEAANSTTGEKAKSFLLARSEGTDAFRVDRNSAEFRNARINGVTTLKNMEFSRRNLQAPEGITDKLAYTGGVVVGAGEGAVATVKGIGSGIAGAYEVVTNPEKRAQIIEDFKKMDLGKAWDSMDDHAKEELVTRALNDLYNNEYALGKVDGNLVGGLAVGAGLGKAVKAGADALKMARKGMDVSKVGRVVPEGQYSKLNDTANTYRAPSDNKLRAGKDHYQHNGSYVKEPDVKAVQQSRKAYREAINEGRAVTEINAVRKGKAANAENPAWDNPPPHKSDGVAIDYTPRNYDIKGLGQARPKESETPSRWMAPKSDVNNLPKQEYRNKYSVDADIVDKYKAEIPRNTKMRKSTANSGGNGKWDGGGEQHQILHLNNEQIKDVIKFKKTGEYTK